MKKYLIHTYNTAAGLALALFFVAVAVVHDLGTALCAKLGLPCAFVPRLGVISTSVVSNMIQPKYSKVLLDRAIQMVRLNEFASKYAIEPNLGAKSVRMYAPPEGDLSATGAPAALTEGVAPTDDRDFSFTPVDVPLVQIGQVGSVTDIATTVGLIDYLKSAIDVMGDDFALIVDKTIRDKLTHASTGLTKRYAQGAADFAALQAATLANGRLVPKDLLDAMTRLKLNRAPQINGAYAAILAPQGCRDLMADAEFREVVRNANAERIFKGEVGDYFGCRVVETTQPHQEDETEGTFAASFSTAGTNTTGMIYTGIVTGKGAYGTVDMAKLGGIAKKPTIIVIDKPDSGNRLGQKVYVGWKAYFAAAVLKPSWGIALRHKTQFAS